MTTCSSGDGHCCWVKGKVCKYLEEDSIDGRKWSCGLRRERGNWEDVYTDQRYIENILPFWIEHDIGTTRCGDWPVPGQRCDECGIDG